MTESIEYIDIIKKYYGTNHPALFSALNNYALINKVKKKKKHNLDFNINIFIYI